MLQQEGADLITGTLTDPSFTHAVERLEVNLLGDLRRDELHGRALHRLGDRLGIAEVVLLAYARRQSRGLCGACSNGLGKYELRRMFSPKRETKPASAQHDDNPVMTAYPHCPQSAFHFLEVLIKTAVGQRRAPGSKDRRRVGNTPRLVFQQVRQAEKRNGGPRAEGTFVRHGCHILKT